MLKNILKQFNKNVSIDTCLSWDIDNQIKFPYQQSTHTQLHQLLWAQSCFTIRWLVGSLHIIQQCIVF